MTTEAIQNSDASDSKLSEHGSSTGLGDQRSAQPLNASSQQHGQNQDEHDDEDPSLSGPLILPVDPNKADQEGQDMLAELAKKLGGSSDSTNLDGERQEKCQ